MIFSLFGKNKSHKPLESYFNGCENATLNKIMTL
ncbi:Hypothetical protein HP17_03704 [Helicobacter pylori NCTC 11637 = CCUG 17874 = ATCC 43504 = JCM 12093]|nr:Hypothetical protein HP17_03704 [Helicobacter pylori NCTC 11637 = CCUG 17874 = ATCC 43504 = JCM 12093]